MKKSYKYRVVAKMEAAGETKERRFEDYESMVSFLGFMLMISYKVEVYFLEFWTETCLKPISEYEAEKMMYRSGEFVFNVEDKG